VIEEKRRTRTESGQQMFRQLHDKIFSDLHVGLLHGGSIRTRKNTSCASFSVAKLMCGRDDRD